MLTVLILTYYLLGRLVPGWLALMFFRQVQGWAVSAGIIAGIVSAVVLYISARDLGRVNAGLVAVGINAALMFGLSRLRPATTRDPVCALPQGTNVPAGAEPNEAAETATLPESSTSRMPLRSGGQS